MSNIWKSIDRIFRDERAWRWSVAGSLLAAVARGMGASGALDQVLTAIQFGFLLLTLAVLSPAEAVIARRRPWGWPYWVVLGMGFFCIVSAAWSSVPLVTLSRASLFLLILIVVLQTARVRWTHSPLVRNVDLKMLYWGVVVVSGIALVLAFLGVDQMWGTYNRFKGFTANATIVAWMAAVVFPIGYAGAHELHGKSRVRVLSGAAILCATVVISGTRGATVALILAIVLVHALTRKAWITAVCFAAALVLGSVVSLSGITLVGDEGAHGSGAAEETPALDDQSGLVDQSAIDPSGVGRVVEPSADISSGRFGLWQAGVELASNRPVAGWGYGSTSHLDEFSNANGMSMHNAYLSSLLETGLVGLLLLLTFLTSLLFRLDWRSNAGIVACAIVVGVNGLFESSLVSLGSPVTILSWLVLGAVLSARRTSRPTPPTR